MLNYSYLNKKLREAKMQEKNHKKKKMIDITHKIINAVERWIYLKLM